MAETSGFSQSGKKSIYIAILIVGGVLIIDQIIKLWVKTSFHPGGGMSILGDWFVIRYTENPGMAFGMQLPGGHITGKLVLSIFRIIAVSGIAWYLYKNIKEKVPIGFVICMSFILAGAMGNIIDSAFYDFIFTTPEYAFDYLPETDEWRSRGFLLGNVVDMFYVHAYYPSWIPYVGGAEIFRPIFNFADASITIGVIFLIFGRKKYFQKEEESENEVVTNKTLENDQIDPEKINSVESA